MNAPTPCAPEELERRIDGALEARRRVIERLGTTEIVAAMAAAASACRDPRGARPLLLQGLTRATGLAAGMLERAIDHIFSPVTAAAMAGLVSAELGRPGSSQEASGLEGPRLVFHRLAGNVPGQSIPVLVCSLLVRSACLLRESGRQPVLTETFLSQLARTDADLAAMVVAANWPASDQAADLLVAGRASRTELYGSDPTLAQLAGRYREAGLAPALLHGPRQSLAYVTERAADARAAEGLARDIVMYEGQGCLSPHHIIHEGKQGAADRFARLLAGELDRLAVDWPRCQQGLEIESRRRAFLAQRELLRAKGRAGRDLTGPSEAWHIAVEAPPTDSLQPGPGTRVVTLIAGGRRQQALRLCRITAAPLAAVSLACEEGERRRLAGEFEAAGATLVSTAGAVQEPPLSWRQDGRDRLRDLVETGRGEAA